MCIRDRQGPDRAAPARARPHLHQRRDPERFLEVPVNSDAFLRNLSILGGCSLGGCLGSWNPRTWRCQVRVLDGVEAVSYTHLRAHETKANLVCRLLLEKKKKKT